MIHKYRNTDDYELCYYEEPISYLITTPPPYISQFVLISPESDKTGISWNNKIPGSGIVPYQNYFIEFEIVIATLLTIRHFIIL